MCPVNKPPVVKLLKNGLDCPGQAFVEGEAFPGPVNGVADGAHLFADGAAEFALPFPYLGDEFFPTVVPAGFSFGFFQPGFYLGLGGDAGVVHAGEPQHLIALHAFAAGYGIHEGVVEGVPHV